MSSLVRVSLVCMLFFIAGCGFMPLYGKHGPHTTDNSIQRSFDDIYISNIPDREGQYLRNALIDRLYKAGHPMTPVYTLQIDRINQSITDLGVTKGADATRAQLRLSTTMRLLDQASGKTLLQRDLTATTSYNVLQSQFTTRVSEDNARQNGLDELSRQIEARLALYFR